ncbi:MAG: hypothetical protein JST57_13100 [Bacteroidetes bacterium]|nr:hypothetical protein [Bacteroidota bacterium]
MSLEEKIFEDASDLLGNPINDWEFVGIEFNDDSPHLRYYPLEGKIAISLSLRAKEDNRQYLFQLSHELCHLFYPKKEYPSLIEHDTLVINEGISTYFSVKTTGSILSIEEHLRNDLRTHSNNYFQALELVEKLLQIDSEAIQKLRKFQPRIDLLSKADFENAKIEIEEDLIKALLLPFK